MALDKESLIADICEPLARHAYQASQDQQADVEKVRSVVGDKDPPASCEIIEDLETWVNSTTQSNTASERSSSNRSSAVRKDPSKLTPNLHQDAFELCTK